MKFRGYSTGDRDQVISLWQRMLPDDQQHDEPKLSLKQSGYPVQLGLTGYTPSDLTLYVHVNHLNINMRLPYGKIELFV